MKPNFLTFGGITILLILTGLSLIAQIVVLLALLNAGEAIKFPAYVFLAIVAEACSFLVLAPLFFNFFKQVKRPFSKFSSVTLTLQGFAFGKLVPFGDYMIWRRRLRQVHGIIGSALEYLIIIYVFGILTLVVLFLVGQIAATIVYPSADTEGLLMAFTRVPFAITAFILFIVVFSKTTWLRVRAQRFFKRYFGEAAKTPLAIVRSRRVSRKQFGFWILLLCASWLFEGLAYFFTMQAVGVEVPLLLAVYGYTFVRLFIILPLFPGGIGEVEAASTALFAGYGFDAATVLTGSLLFRFVGFWIPVVLAIITVVLYRSRRGAKV